MVGPPRSFSTRLVHVVVVLSLACDSAEVGPDHNPVPIVVSTIPAVVERSSSTTFVDIVGLGFVHEAEVRWKGSSRPTMFSGAELLTVALEPADLANGPGEISVFNPSPGGGSSASVILLVANARPVLTSISPTQAPAVQTTAIELQVEGSDFVTTGPGARVHWDGVPLATTAVSSTQLVASVPDYLLRNGRSAAVSVRNPPPGGGESDPLYFGVENPVPLVTGTSPGGVVVGSDTDLSVLGSGFVQRAVVVIEGSRLTPQSVSGTRLTVRLPAQLAVSGATLSLSVENPSPGGGTSSPVDIVVWERSPYIEALSPRNVFAGSPDFLLTIYGWDFDPDATVTWNGEPRAATVVNDQVIELVVSAADVVSERTVDILVANPGAEGPALAQFRVGRVPIANGFVLGARPSGWEFVMAHIDGSESTPITVPEGGFRIDVAPVAMAVIYNSGRIMEMDLLTGVTRRVTPAAEDGAFPGEDWARYSADGQWIYYMANASETNEWQIRRVRSSGGASETLAESSTQSYGYPAPSHSGTRVVYTVGVGSNSRLAVLDLTTGMSRDLGVPGATARWSPADDWIVYWTWAGPLRAIRPDGTNDRLLTGGGQFQPGFDFSVDGTWIAAATSSGTGVRITFPGGIVEGFADLGDVLSVAVHGP